MRKTLLAMILLSMTLAAEGGELWDRLWLNADQKGDALLHRGDAEAAMKAYADPRRKAYAQLQAGDYKNAAEALKNFHDADSDYNRGNALAHVGDLVGALKAYDAALRQNPNDKDARHNRDLVADAMKRSSRQDRQNSSAQKGSDRNASTPNPHQSEKDGKGGKDSDKEASAEKSMDRKPSTQNRDEESANKQSANEPQQGSDASQAQQDASLAGQAKKVDRIPAKKSEQQIEEEQWLHSIPDDPGGLLRRKFLIEHMLRQQEQER